MVEKTINVKLKTASDTQANWESKNITLLDGELAYDKTKKNLKIGDGTTSWNNLPYLIPEVEESGFKELYSAINFSDYLYAPIIPITTNGAYFSDENGNPITESFQIGETLYITNESVKTGQVVQISAFTALDEMFFEKFDDGTAHIFNQSKTYEIHFNLIGKISNYYTKSEVDELIFETPTIEVENFSQLVADQTQNATGTITEQQSSNIEKAKSLIVLDTTTSMSYYFTIQELLEGVLGFICDNTTSNVEESKIMFLLQGTQWMAMELRNPRFTQDIYDELKDASSFIDVVELPVENIDEQAIYRIPVESDELVGELVVSNPSITCNKLKFNSNLSNYEMNYILSQLTYYNFNGMNIHPIWSNATATKVVFAYNYGVGISLLYTEDIANPSNSTIIWIVDNGWVTTELQINEVGVSSLMGLPIGTENDKLRKVISMNGDFVRELSYDYLVYKDGLWSKLSNDIGTAIVEKNLYITFGDDLEQVLTFTDEEFEKLKNADNALLKIRTISANGLLFETIHTRNGIGEDNDEEIISFISYNISSGKLDISRLVKNENTTPKIIFETDEISIGGTTDSFIDVEELPVENIDEQAIYRVKVEPTGQLVVSDVSTTCNDLGFNTNLSNEEVINILSQLTYYNFNGYNINPIWSNATLTKVVFAYNYSDGHYSFLYTEDIQNPSNSTVIWTDTNGWAISGLALNETGISSYHSLPIGSENDKLTNLVLMNGYFPQQPYQYWNYKNGIWIDLAKAKEEVPIITIKDFLQSVLFDESEDGEAVALKTSGELSGYLPSQQIQKIINAREFILHDMFDIYFTYKVFSNSDSNPWHRFTGKLPCADFLAIGGWETTELYFWFTVNANTNEYHITYFATPINSIDIMPVHFIEITDGVMTDEQKQFFKSTTQGPLGGLRYQNLLFKNYDTSTSNTYWLTYAGIITISGNGGKDKVCYSCIHEENIYTFSITYSTGVIGVSDVTTEFTTNSISSGTVDLTNYYKKDETYSNTEIDGLVNSINSKIEIPEFTFDGDFLGTSSYWDVSLYHEEKEQAILAKAFVLTDSNAMSYVFKQTSVEEDIYKYNCIETDDANCETVFTAYLYNSTSTIELYKQDAYLFTESDYEKVINAENNKIEIIELSVDSTQLDGTLSSEQYTLYNSKAKEQVAFKVYNDDYGYTFYLTYSHATDDSGYVYTCTTFDEIHSLTLYDDSYAYAITPIKTVIRISLAENQNGSIEDIMDAARIAVFQSKPENVEFLITDNDWGYIFHLTYAYRIDDGTFRYMVNEADGWFIYLDIMDGFYSYHYLEPNSSGTSSGGLKVVDFPISIDEYSNYLTDELLNGRDLMEADIIRINDYLLLHKVNYNEGEEARFTQINGATDASDVEYFILAVGEDWYEYSYKYQDVSYSTPKPTYTEEDTELYGINHNSNNDDIIMFAQDRSLYKIDLNNVHFDIGSNNLIVEISATNTKILLYYSDGASLDSIKFNFRSGMLIQKNLQDVEISEMTNELYNVDSYIKLIKEAYPLDTLIYYIEVDEMGMCKLNVLPKSEAMS